MRKIPFSKKVLLGIGSTLIVCNIVFGINLYIFKKQKIEITKSLEEIRNKGKQLSQANLFSKEVILTNLGYMDAIIDKQSGVVDLDIIKQHQRFHRWFKDSAESYLAELKNEDQIKNFKLSMEEIKVWGETGDKLFASIKNKDPEAVFAQYDDVLDGTLDKVLERNDVVINDLEEQYFAITKQTDELIKHSEDSEMFLVSLMIATAVISFIALWRLISGINRHMKKVSSQLIDMANQLDAHSNLVTTTSYKLNGNTSSQASGLEQTISSVNQISSMVERNSDTARNSADASTGSAKAATKGKKTVEMMRESINSISESNERIMGEMQNNSDEISKIVTVIGEIEEKTKVINDIVFQTKLLSFNASVEAARAGEHGKGFAVVAEEVGNLASMSGKAADEIGGMLEESIRQVELIVNNSKGKVENLLKLGKEKVEQGINRARECESALDEIINNVNRVNDMVREIADASQEQNTGIKEINSAILGLGNTTRENSGIAQESIQIAEALSSTSLQLNKNVENLAEILGLESSNNKAA